MRAGVADGEGGVPRHLPLHAQGPRDDGRRPQIGLNGRRRNRTGAAGAARRIRYAAAFDGVDGIERSGLVKPVVQRVQQSAVQPDAGADDGFSGREWIVGQADARLRKQLRAIDGEGRRADAGIGIHYAVGKAVDGGATVGGIPAVGGLGTQAGAQFEVGPELDGVLQIRSDELAAPADLGGLRRIGEGRYGAQQEAGQRGEAGLAVLVLREVVVRFEQLAPAARFDLIPSAGPENVIVEGEEVARGAVIRADVRAGGSDGRSAVRGGRAGDDNRACGPACQEGWRESLHSYWYRTKEVEAGARKADARGVQQLRSEDALLLDAEDLLTQAFVDHGERIL